MKLNIVLDLDCTIINTFSEINELYKCMEKSDSYDLNWLESCSYFFSLNLFINNKTIKYDSWGVFRPHLKEFMEFLDTGIDANVYVWTASEKKYADGIVDVIFRNFKKKPILVFNKDDTDIDNARKNVTKDLKRIYERIEDANETNTIIIDDRVEIYEFNKQNAILIPQFSPAEYETSDPDLTLSIINKFYKEDTCLIKIMNWFNDNKDVKDVRDLNYEEIFTYDDYNQSNFDVVGFSHK